MRCLSKRLSYFMAASLILFAVSCNKDEEVSVPENHGTLEGKIYAQNGERYIPAVKVFVDVEGDVYLTDTDENGKFKLNVPEGDHLLYMQAGDGKLFFNTTKVSVKKGETSNVPKSASVLNQQANIAYISGQYDNIESIIIDTLGYQADQLTVQDLSDPSILEDYAAIFLNCGVEDDIESQMYDNLEDYVHNGGSLYASDFAVGYLTGDGSAGNMPIHHHDNEEMFVNHKTCNTPAGGFVPDNMLCTQKQGSSGQLNSADVVSNDIQNVIGGNTMDINYNLGGWEVIKNLGSEFDILIQDNSNYGPLAVRSNSTAPWAQGSGSSGGNGNNNNGNGNSNNEFVTICHIPPGNPNNPHTITISVNALQAHLDHGCYVGSCEGDGGQVLFTTFHNSPQGNLSQDTYDILQYFIMNL